MTCNLRHPMGLRHPVQPIAFAVSFLQSQDSIGLFCKKALQKRLYSVKSCGLAMIRRLLKNIGLDCSIQSLLRGFFAKETCVFRESTDRSHPISRSPRLVCHVPLKRHQLHWDWRMKLNDTPTATHCNTLQHIATHCNTLQHTATHCNTGCRWVVFVGLPFCINGYMSGWE